MIPALPSVAHLLNCEAEADLLLAVGQGALALHVVYLESRRPLRLPGHVVLGAWLRPHACMPLLDGAQVRVVGAPPPQMSVIQTPRSAEPAPEFWPPRHTGAL